MYKGGSMSVVKIDTYEYELVDIFDYVGDYSHTLIYVYFESMVDPDIHDIIREISEVSLLYADGMYFRAFDYELINDLVASTSQLKIKTMEDTSFENEEEV